MPLSRSREAEVTLVINNDSLMTALRSMTINNGDFRHQSWSIWDAECMEAAARMIRRGYAEERPCKPDSLGG
jgi:hypothetical protein